ncbi:cysteine desulfurase [Ktedonobacteria bacterium brp13]|nr:cysteine desulfurase [Ktedonobacteria bacterium brp13]
MFQSVSTSKNLALDVRVRDAFPVFRDHPATIYFDSAATTQKPLSVIQAVNRYHCRAVNIGRGSYPWAVEVDEQVRAVRENVARFLHAHSATEVVFTSGATDSFNRICLSWGLANLHNGDEVLLCAADHKSCTLPWLNLKRLLLRLGITVKILFYGVDEAGSIDRYDLLSKITTRTRLVVMTHINNVYGHLNDIAAIRAMLPHPILLALDASQSIGHIDVNVQHLGVDFLAFSGHKMFASTGIGVLWVDQQWHSQLHPSMVGGGSGSSSIHPQTDDFDSATMPDLLEAGTQNIAGILSLGAATAFLQSIGMEAIHTALSALTTYLVTQLQTLDQLTFVPHKRFEKPENAYGLVSFRFEGLSSREVGSFLEQHHIFVRTGDHCMSIPGESEDSLRVSLHLYNTRDEIDRLLQVLQYLLG